MNTESVDHDVTQTTNMESVDLDVTQTTNTESWCVVHTKFDTSSNLVIMLFKACILQPQTFLVQLIIK